MQEPTWTNETTRRIAHELLRLCQPSEGESEPIDWGQVIGWFAEQREAAIRERDKRREAN
jgi:hypothetical protein